MKQTPDDAREPSRDERARRLAAVFGDVLPDATSDEDAEGWGDPDHRTGGVTDDQRLKDEVPPHHG